jgi:hypothetical protein
MTVLGTVVDPEFEGSRFPVARAETPTVFLWRACGFFALAATDQICFSDQAGVGIGKRSGRKGLMRTGVM